MIYILKVDLYKLFYIYKSFENLADKGDRRSILLYNLIKTPIIDIESGFPTPFLWYEQDRSAYLASRWPDPAFLLGVAKVIPKNF